MAIVQKSEKARYLILRAFVALMPWIPLIGCKSLLLPKAVIATPSATVTQSGPVQVPASVASDVTEIEIPLSGFARARDSVSSVARVTPQKASGSVVQGATPRTASGPAATLEPASDAGAIRIVTRHDNATAPRSFAPPTPPTALEAARADTVRYFAIAGILGLFAAGLLAWSQHYLAAIKVAAGAIALPVLGYFFGNAVAMVVSVALFALGAGVFVGWQVLKRRGLPV